MARKKAKAKKEEEEEEEFHVGEARSLFVFDLCQSVAEVILAARVVELDQMDDDDGEPWEYLIKVASAPFLVWIHPFSTLSQWYGYDEEKDNTYDCVSCDSSFHSLSSVFLRPYLCLLFFLSSWEPHSSIIGTCARLLESFWGNVGQDYNDYAPGYITKPTEDWISKYSITAL